MYTRHLPRLLANSENITATISCSTRGQMSAGAERGPRNLLFPTRSTKTSLERMLLSRRDSITNVEITRVYFGLLAAVQGCVHPTHIHTHTYCCLLHLHVLNCKLSPTFKAVINMRTCALSTILEKYMKIRTF